MLKNSDGRRNPTDNIGNDFDRRKEIWPCQTETQLFLICQINHFIQNALQSRNLEVVYK